MYDIIPLVLILLSLIVLIIIILRKFPVLASLDVNTIQSEKEAQFKEQIIGKRLKRNIIRYSSKFTKQIKPFGLWLLSLWKTAYQKLLDFKENYNKHEGVKSAGRDIDTLLQRAEDAVREEKYDEAEKVFIEAISVDSQSLRAFKGLGKLYQERKQYLEAKQTFEHVLRLLEHDESKSQIAYSEEAGQGVSNDNSYAASIYYELAVTCRDNEEYRAADTNIGKACDLMPNNPRYLDMKLEISIMNKDKGSALDALAKLKEANPENNKIGEFEAKIREL
jgi:tetratricopeptide (TPR) repeat protein